MAKKANAPVGVCPCPVRECKADKSPLFRFAKRAGEDSRARKAGKYYGRCPSHGWFGYDGASAMQVYIRAHGKLSEGETWEATQGANDASESGRQSESATPPPPPAPPTPAPPATATRKPAASTPRAAPVAPKAAVAKPNRRDVWDL